MVGSGRPSGGRVQLIVSLAAACVAIVDVCAEEDRKFQPDLDASEKSGQGGNVCEGLDPGTVSNDHDYVCCTAEWCADGYEGQYCVRDDNLRPWARRNCSSCSLDSRAPLFPSDFGSCGPYLIDVSCSPRSESLRRDAGC